jgi:hypothetical protein
MKVVPAAIVLIGGANAFADTLTLPLSISSTPTSNAAFSTSFLLPVSQFDPALGTLTNVSIAVSLPTVQESIGVKDSHTTGSDGTVTYSPNQPYTITVYSAPLVLKTPDATSFPALTTGFFSAAFSYPPTAGPYTGTSPADGTIVQTIDTYSGSLTATYAVPAANLGQLTGTGTLPIEFAVQTWVDSFSTVGASPAFGVGAFSGTATVTYTYTAGAVPEPASLSLLGIAVPLLMHRRRELV